MLKGKLVALLLLCWMVNLAGPEMVKVGLFYKEKIGEIHFSVSRGTYHVYTNGQLVLKLNKNEKAIFTLSDQVQLTSKGKVFSSASFQLKGKDYVNHFKIKSLKHPGHMYDDHLKVTRKSNSLQLINTVQLENYVSSVVEGEAGYQLPSEFYKLQAILSRTYVLKNKDRHLHQGFNICDKVHCQVYHHKCTKEEIYKSTMATNALVVVDDKLNLINTIFHSNCGGQTCNSEDVWNEELSYLRAIKDSFCLSSSRALWKKSFPESKLNHYFKQRCGKSMDVTDMYKICQVDHRENSKYFLSVPFTRIRKDLKLRSTYFYIEQEGDRAVLYGRGSGHGVGLCQQGGIEMANRGYSYVDILKHYYKGIHIINRKALIFFNN